MVIRRQAICLITIIMAALVLFGCPASTPSNVTVPNLINLTQAEAESAITGAGLTVGTVNEEYHATIPANHVIIQTPSAGTSVAPGSAVNFVVSKGPATVTVPNVVGMTQSAAQSAITGAGLTVGIVNKLYHATVPADEVISQTPSAGASVAPSTAIVIVVSRGPAPVTVPNLIGATQTAALAAITATGLTVGTVTELYHPTIPANQVINQSPSGGVSVARGTAVDLTVSKGPAPVTVPNVVGMTQSAAQSAIMAAGLTVGAVTEQYHATVPAGQVISQTPSAGASVTPGTAVNLVISKGPAPVTVPNVVGMNQAAAQSTITGAGLTLGTVTEQYHATVPAGQVISQDPGAGTSVAPGTQVDLVISKGPAPVSVPSVVGMMQTPAQAAIAAASLTVGTIDEQYSFTIPEGQVIDQDPDAGAIVPAGSAINLVVSKGLPHVTVPNVVGKTQRVAEALIDEAALVVGVVTEVINDTVPVGNVISQNPAAGASVDMLTLVNLTVSLGSRQEVIHRQAWQDLIDGAHDSKFNKYAIYSSRSLMVLHPEVYLQADAVWLEQIATVYGGWLAEYQHRDRIDDQHYSQNVGALINEAFISGAGTEPTFSWQDFQRASHVANAKNSAEFYPEDAPCLNWLDMRLPLLWNAMKGTGWSIPYVSLAEALYFELRSEGKDVYLAITDNGHGYVIEVNGDEAVLHDPMTYPAAASATDGEIVLVMSQTAVWYPLIGRDDSHSNPGLLVAVQDISASAHPDLSDFEYTVLNDILFATELDSAMEYRWAVLFASRFGKQWAWRAKPIRDLTRSLFYERYGECGDRYTDIPYEFTALNMAVTELSNRVSPAAALLARAAQEQPTFPDSFTALSNQYLQWFKRSDSGLVYGHYYPAWLPNLDDKIISAVGDCFVEACNCGAALQIVKNPDWDVWISNYWHEGGGGHVVAGVYTDAGGGILSNGLYNSYQDDGPLWAQDTSEMFPLVYRLDSGFLSSGQTCNGYCFAPFTVPFTNLAYGAAAALLADIQAYEPAFLVAKGTYGSIDPSPIGSYITYAETLQDDWLAYDLPPLGSAPVQVPDLVGLSEVDAVIALGPPELLLYNVASAPTPEPAGTVISQVPAAGTSVDPGAGVNVVVSSGPAPIYADDYFVRTEGHGIKYHITDTQGGGYSDYAWAVSQYTDDSIGFVFTLIGDTTENSIGGLDARTYDGRTLVAMIGGDLRNQGLFFYKLSMPTETFSTDTWTYFGGTAYWLEMVGETTVGGTAFENCIKIYIDDSANTAEYLRGSGHFILAPGIGIVELVFTRSVGGSQVKFEYVEHRQFTRNTISGTISLDAVPAVGKIVQIHTVNWGTRALTDSLGRFSIQAYGPDIVLRIGDDSDDDGALDVIDGWPKTWKVINITGNVDVAVPLTSK